jgi:hypothetical protein
MFSVQLDALAAILKPDLVSSADVLAVLARAAENLLELDFDCALDPLPEQQRLGSGDYQQSILL